MDMEWSSDAQEVVKDITSNMDPYSWETRYELLLIKRRIKNFHNWKVHWNRRETNRAADDLVKFAFENNVTFESLRNNFAPPLCITEILFAEMRGV